MGTNFLSDFIILWHIDCFNISALFESLSKTHLSKLSTGSTQEDPSLFNRKIVDGT